VFYLSLQSGDVTGHPHGENDFDVSSKRLFASRIEIVGVTFSIIDATSIWIL